ncbi:MAG: hypothetical protein KDK99_17915 [Verrucomicrobiales bacterium]|nr:hypothetical protein [Verrucomicrobiales bacterium]
MMAMRKWVTAWIVVCGVTPGSALAGMTSYSLTEVASFRLETISFFVVAFLLCALGVRWAWNVLARDVSWMPLLKYRHALALLVVSGLFVNVALTLIAGARELLTPGAWVRTGTTHHLATPEKAPAEWLEFGRRRALEQLRDALWNEAKANGGRLAASPDLSKIDPALWQGIHPQGVRFGYVAEARPGQGRDIVAYEGDDYGPARFVLRTDGRVERMTSAELAQALEQQWKGGDGQ